MELRRRGAGLLATAALLGGLGAIGVAGPAAAAPSVKLMTWYADAGWQGKHKDIYGDRGTCDRAGYIFRPSQQRYSLNAFDGYWGTRLSSIRGYGQCHNVRITNLDNSDVTTGRLPASFGRTKFNDNVGIVQVFS